MAREKKQPEHGPMKHADSRILYKEEHNSCLPDLGIQAEYEKDYDLIEADTVPQFCYLIESGRVVSYEYTPSGNIRVYHVHEKNSLIGEELVLFGLPSQISFKTGTRTKVRCIRGRG